MAFTFVPDYFFARILAHNSVWLKVVSGPNGEMHSSAVLKFSAENLDIIISFSVVKTLKLRVTQLTK